MVCLCAPDADLWEGGGRERESTQVRTGNDLKCSVIIRNYNIWCKRNRDTPLWDMLTNQNQFLHTSYPSFLVPSLSSVRGPSGVHRGFLLGILLAPFLHGRPWSLRVLLPSLHASPPARRDPSLCPRAASRPGLALHPCLLTHTRSYTTSFQSLSYLSILDRTDLLKSLIIFYYKLIKVKNKNKKNMHINVKAVTVNLA